MGSITGLPSAILGVLLVGLILVDAFETVVLPQTVNRRWRPARLWYRATWRLWTAFALALPEGKRRLGALNVYGPLSLLGLFAVWAFSLVFAFALLQWGFGSHLDLVRGQPIASALNILSFTPKKGAKIIKKVLESAIANAEHNNGADIDELKITSIYVEKGPVLKRFQARAKGRGNRIVKPTCHVFLTVGDGKKD